jgi:3-hydroxyisobutyrate dehydrogenase-like beta-hydroxyacid dehydrogenase
MRGDAHQRARDGGIRPGAQSDYTRLLVQGCTARRANVMVEFSTVGLLYPGEMGAAFARLLIAGRTRVVTTLAGRSENTARLARDAGVIVLDSLKDVVRESQVILSLVAPSAAAQVADEFCELAHLSPRLALYVDANSIGPEQARSIAEKLAAVNRDFVDAAINGLARNISTSGTLYLSGTRASEFEKLVANAMRLRILGTEPGQASTMKMLLGGLSKGLCALFMELAIMAQRREMLPQMLEACAMIYPGVTAVVDRMLPTYAKHADRRAAEMRELQQTVQNTGMEPCLVEAIRELHERLAVIKFSPSDGASVTTMIVRAIHESFLTPELTSTSIGPK